mmetsp:Transcript_7908/g.14562  ORF Transcript_7908/g.14562 Transcript_7908/m.14562 type:complete len:208 (-) Transcript_7908:429-1052(-)|eukprot:CAMPEP_0201602270 /NCGR_PEP_ID=MMETSP0492-20130828/3047_1 /ASSEMBLY_ACC=CAM_ASM_000837 /TAXON_ID=420259 /ORGANISM="Thalassiosira gravida, Strain GMp14c1" /LENGTH=207 /DNA_ID=CAMNT_0048065739 /DNA_START=56 /DNA_END=679 /DNA_ORIENTATION=+
MILHPLPLSPLATVATNAAFKLPALVIRGGATAGVSAAFDMGLAKTRLEGLAYGTVTSLMMNGALRLFSATPKKLLPIPDDADLAKKVRFDNCLKIIFGLCMSISVALGLYTTTIFTLMSIYSKTALGMGLQSDYNKWFDACWPYRKWGFLSFLGTIVTFNASWILSLILNYEGEIRWLALPAIVVGLVGLYHYNSIIGLAGAIIYS